MNFSAKLRFSGVAFKCRVEKIKWLRRRELGSILLVTECRVEFAKLALLDSRVSSRRADFWRLPLLAPRRFLVPERGRATFVFRCSAIARPTLVDSVIEIHRRTASATVADPLSTSIQNTTIQIREMERRHRLSIGTRMGQCRMQQKSCPVGLSGRGLNFEDCGDALSLNSIAICLVI